jgi:DNA-binding CsgD family transcriptional regulator
MTANLQSLSEREKETLRLLLEGHDAKSIAHTLGVSVHAVNERLRTSRRKLDVSSSREAARMLGQFGQAHNSVVGKQIGVFRDDVDVNKGPVRDGRLGVIRIGVLVIGGTLIMSTIISTALLAWFGSGGTEPGPLPNWTTETVAVTRSGQPTNTIRMEGDRLLWNGGEASERDIRHFLGVTKELYPQPLLTLTYSVQTNPISVQRVRLLIDEIVRCEPSTCVEITTGPR